MLTQTEIKMFERVIGNCAEHYKTALINADKQPNNSISQQLYKDNAQIFLALAGIMRILLNKETEQSKSNSGANHYETKFKGIE